MQIEKIQAEIQNQSAYNKILNRIAEQIKAIKKAQADLDRENQKLQKLLIQKDELLNTKKQAKNNE